MTNNDFDEEIDQLAVEIEQTIVETQQFLDGLPEFEPRSQRSQKLHRKVTKQS